jgi:hypothetical protein
MELWSVKEIFGFHVGDRACLPNGEFVTIKRILGSQLWLAGPGNTVCVYPAVYECRVKPEKMTFRKWLKWFFTPWRMVDVKELSKPIPVSRNPYRES